MTVGIAQLLQTLGHNIDFWIMIIFGMSHPPAVKKGFDSFYI